jgi:superfamily I DNA and/or RNA helicase
MKNELSIDQQLVSFKNALLNIPSTDILVHCDIENPKLKKILNPTLDETVTIDKAWKNILKQNENLSSTNNSASALCLASGIFKSEKQTPIFITPLHFQWVVKNQTFQLEPIWENTFINPWLEKQLKTYQQEIQFDSEKSIQENIIAIQHIEFFQKQGVSIEETYFIGNFHHHRFLILREIETLLNKPKSKLVQQLFGEKNQITEPLQLKIGQLTSQDSDQNEAIHTFEKENLVVEGPPGTGKSTLITNLIGKSVASNYKVLLFSEKKVALEIIYQKAKQHHIENLCYYNPENKTEPFIRTLEKSWKQMEAFSEIKDKNLFVSKQYRNRLQSLLDKLNSPTLIENCSYKEIKAWFQNNTPTEGIFLTQHITIDTWKKHENIIEKLFEGEHILPPFYGYKKIDLEEQNEIEKLNEKCSLLIEYVEKFNLENKKLLNTFKRKISFIQIINNDKDKLYFSIYLNKNKKEKFQKLIQKYKTQINKINEYKNDYHAWSKIPTITQLEHWKETLKNGSFYQKWKLKRTLNHFLLDNTTPPIVLIDLLIKIESEKEKQNKILHALQQLGIHHPETEIPQIELTLSLLNHYSDCIEEIKQQDLENITNEHFSFLELIQWIEKKIELPDKLPLKEFITNIINDLNYNVKNSLQLKELPFEIIRFIQQFKTIDECKQAISNHYYYLIQHYYPQLTDFENSTIISLVDKIVEQENIEQNHFEKEIIQKQKEKFHQYNQLILQSDTKLSAEEKEFKKQLKNGKRILVKAFAKTRHRQSIREYIESDAIHWIYVLMPIWLVTPSQLATLFPLKEDLFDICIADEASQIPLMNGIGALQRSKRAIILGDSKQMSPSNYFSGVHHSVDLLHQATYYLEKRMLKHHYRSNHSALIQFSNKHFYNNQLQPFPTTNVSNPLQHHYIENGRFENRTNQLEAEKMSELITKHIHSTKKIGIVAFSNEQKELIYKVITPEIKQLFEEKINQNEVFLKSLEQVQGDECDILLISLGYAKNTNGHFQLQMGPLNRMNGYRRLNVLFTRAKESIQFVTSVKSNDFPWTDNESILLLKDYIYQIENQNNSNTINFPFALTPQINKNTLFIDDLHTKLTTEQEMVTCVDTLQKRGWEIR